MGEILIRKGVINGEQLKHALEKQKRTREFLGEILRKDKLISERDLLEALSEQFDIPLEDIEYKYLDWDFVGRFSPSLILDYKCMPLEKDAWSVKVAITNPLDAWTMKKAEEETKGSKLKFVLVTEEQMNDAIKRYRSYIQRVQR